MAADDFNRSDQDPIAGDWAAAGLADQLRLVGNAVAAGTGGTDNASRYTPSSVALSQCKITTIADGDGGPAIHLDASGNGYAFVAFSGAFTLVKFVAGSGGAVDSVGGTIAANDVMRIRRSGGNIIGSVNGVDQVTTADSDFLTGNPGLFIFNGSLRLDDWTDGVDPWTPEQDSTFKTRIVQGNVRFR